MPDSENAVFLVDVRCEPAAIKIGGRACFKNSGCLREFFTEMIKAGRTRFVLDFAGCASMDSTFLGVLAGTALELKRLDPPGSIVLCRIGARNLELVRNLGLHRLMTVDDDRTTESSDKSMNPLHVGPPASEVDNARMVLKAHEDLIAADPQNQERFQDVLEFLKDRVKEG